MPRGGALEFLDGDLDFLQLDLTEKEHYIKESMNFNKGQKVVCAQLSDYEGDKLEKGDVLTVSTIGINVVGFEEYLNNDGEPIKFFKYYFKEYKDFVEAYFRRGDQIDYAGANWTVTSFNSPIIEVSYNGGGQDNTDINIFNDVYKVKKQQLKSRDKVSLVPLSSIQTNKSDGMYYLGPYTIDTDVLHRLYLDMEIKSTAIIKKSVEGGDCFILKGFDKNLYVPSQILVLRGEQEPLVEYKVGDVLTFKKGKELKIGEEYTIVDILKLSSKTIIGVHIPNGRMYINKKQCKLKTSNGKKLVKKECKDIFQAPVA